MKTQLILLLLTCSITAYGVDKEQQELSDFLPKGYIIFDKVVGDLNNDGIEDCALLIKGTNNNNIVLNQFDEKVDRNRRGLILLFNKNGQHELALENYNCFASENEDGGVYFPPELSIDIRNGKLYIHYGHGRYGHWEYTFRFQNTDFELIGYDASYQTQFLSDWVTFDEISINFISKKKLIKEVIKVNEEGKETFKEKWENIVIDKLIKLSKVNDFYEIDMSIYRQH